MASVRASIASGAPIEDNRGAGAKSVTNYLSRRSRDEDARSVESRPEYVVLPPKAFDVLALKNNALFLSVLPELVASSAFETVALIRHPREVFSSWLSVPFPVRDARLPASEKFWPKLREIGASDDPLPARMALLFEELIGRIVRSNVTTLSRCEDVVRNAKVVFEGLGIAMGDTALVQEQPAIAPDNGVEATLEELRKLKGAAHEQYPL